MRIFSQKNKDLEEISSHIEQLKQQQENFEERKDDVVEPIEIISQSTGQVAGEFDLDNIPPEDVFEIIGPVDELSETDKETNIEQFTTMETETRSVGMCDMCKTAMLFEKNLSGLAIHGKFFACEKCCQNASKKDLDNWAKSRMAKPTDVKPIALWLMQKENKARLF